MAQEVYVVFFESCGFDGSYGGEGGYSNTQLRGVFDSIEKARQYCENPDHYLDDMDTDYYPERSIKESWYSDGKTYMIIDYESETHPEDYEQFYFSIETTNLQ